VASRWAAFICPCTTPTRTAGSAGSPARGIGQLGRKGCGDFVGGTCGRLLILLDERNDDEDTLSGPDFAYDKRVGPPARIRGRTHQVVGAADAGPDDLASGGQGPQIGDVQIGQQYLAQRPRNRRRRHEQHMRRAALRAQGFALGDTESMLLVDDREGQVRELDRFLDESVRAHDDAAARRGQQTVPGRRRGELLQRGAALVGRQRARQQCDPVAERLHEPSQSHRVLTRQQIRRRQ
jgi:hypothetical protein